MLGIGRCSVCADATITAHYPECSTPLGLTIPTRGFPSAPRVRRGGQVRSQLSGNHYYVMLNGGAGKLLVGGPCTIGDPRAENFRQQHQPHVLESQARANANRHTSSSRTSRPCKISNWHQPSAPDLLFSPWNTSCGQVISAHIPLSSHPLTTNVPSILPTHVEDRPAAGPCVSPGP